MGDQNPSHAQRWNEYEKTYILPKLRITKDSCALDIGCGIGRWAEILIPLCVYYCGMDFSEKMIETARKYCAFPGRDYEFYHMPFQDIGKLNRKFDTVIISFVCMYINDMDLRDAFISLLPILHENSTLYIIETVANKERLSLDEFPSVALKRTYDAIYRTTYFKR